MENIESSEENWETMILQHSSSRVPVYSMRRALNYSFLLCQLFQLPGPTCLFYQRDNGDLVPVAIQLMPEPADDNPVCYWTNSNECQINTTIRGYIDSLHCKQL